MYALRDTMKGLVRGAVFTRTRDDLRPAIQMARSGSHSIFFEAADSRILVVLHRPERDAHLVVHHQVSQPLTIHQDDTFHRAGEVDGLLGER